MTKAERTQAVAEHLVALDRLRDRGRETPESLPVAKRLSVLVRDGNDGILADAVALLR